MKHVTGLAVTGFLLILASPAAAQDWRMEGGEYKRYAPTLVETRRGPLFPDRARGISLAQEEVVREDGSPGKRTRLVGSIGVAPNLRVGVGLFSIVGSTEKEVVRRRTDPAADVRPRDSRVAALGLSLRF